MRELSREVQGLAKYIFTQLYTTYPDISMYAISTQVANVILALRIFLYYTRLI